MLAWAFKKNWQTDKPNSVVNGHSSRRTVADTLKQPTRVLGGQPIEHLFGLATSGVYLAMSCCQSCGALLPHRFTLTHIIEEVWAVYSLLHLSSDCSAQPLAGTLPCVVRTFLSLIANLTMA